MKRLMVILAGLTALGPLSIDTYLPALPDLAEDLGAGTSTAQLTLTACLIGLAVGQAVAGPVSDALGRRRPLLTGVIVFVISSAACMLAPSIEILIGLRLVQGVAGGAAIVIARAMVRDRYGGSVRFYSTLTQVSSVAPIVAPLLGGQILRVASWRGVFAALMIGGTVLVCAVWRWTTETMPDDQRSPGAPTAGRAAITLLTSRAFAGYALAGGLAFGAMFAYISGSAFVLQRIHGLSAQEYSAVFAVNGAGIIATGLLGVRLSAQRQLAAGLSISLVGGLALLLVTLADGELAALLPALFLVVAGIGLSLPGSTALTLSGQPPHVAGTASALLGLAQFVVGGLAAPLAGVAGPRSALPMAVTISFLTVAAVAAFWLSRGRCPQGRANPCHAWDAKR